MVRRAIFVIWAISLALLLGQRAEAQQSNTDDQKKWSPGHPYNITPEVGQFAICINSYAGPTAFSYSKAMVDILRRDYRLCAYFYNRGDVERQEEKKRLEEMAQKRAEVYQQFGQARPQTYWLKHPMRIEEQFAVLICKDSYKDIDAARRDLDLVRRLRMPEKGKDKFFEEMVGLCPLVTGQNAKGETGMVPANPFLSAFVAPNPSIPKAKEPQVDREQMELNLNELKELNATNPYSLLKAPGKFTLVVKVYQAPTVLVAQHADRGVIDRMFPKKSENYLSAAGKQSQQLAEILRSKQLNFDSYVLHTENMSMVTVGSFNDSNDPRMAELANTLAKLRLEPYETLMTPPKPLQFRK
jgi:hypothetical protein